MAVTRQKKSGKADLESTLARLSGLRGQPVTDGTVSLLKEALASPHSHAVVRAARLAVELKLGSLGAELVLAFLRSMEQCVKRDPGCQAKLAIADALYKLEQRAEEVFLLGVRHVQLEPSWGPPVDTAPNLRATCALALVWMNYPGVLIELGDLLADSQVPARVAAARALGYSENPAGAALLRLRVLSGEADPQVLSECLGALVALDAAAAPGFLRKLLERDDPVVVETAALALGSAKNDRAFEVLRNWWERVRTPEDRKTALLAIAMLRVERSREFLLDLVADAPGPTAREALAALGIYRHDDAMRQRVTELALGREDADLASALERAFSQ